MIYKLKKINKTYLNSLNPLKNTLEKKEPLKKMIKKEPLKKMIQKEKATTKAKEKIMEKEKETTSQNQLKKSHLV